MPTPPPSSFTQYEPSAPLSPRRNNKIAVLDCVIGELDVGNFYGPALLVDQVLRDDRVRGVFEQRAGALLGKPRTLKPGDESTKAEQISQIVDELWSVMFPTDVLRQLLEWSLFLGVGFAQLKWQPYKGYMVPVAEVWHPSSVRWSPQEQAYIAQHLDGEVTIRLGDPRWFVLPRFGFAHAGRRGFLRSMLDAYIHRIWDRADWGRFKEQVGKTIPIVEAPPGANDDALKAKVREVARMGSEAAIGIRGPDPSKGIAGWKISLLEAMSTPHESFRASLQMLAADLAVLVLGQWMSTEGQAGLGTNQKAGEPVRLDLQLADADAVECAVYEQVLCPLVEYNFGSRDLAPWPCYQVKPPEDLTAKATQFSTLGDALGKLKAHYGKAMDRRNIAAEFGLKLIDGVELPDYEDPVETTPDPTDPEDQTMVEQSAPRKAATKRAQRDIDTLAHRATMLAIDPVAKLVTRLAAAVRGAGSFDDAKAALLRSMADLDVRALEDELNRSQILAELRGRLAVLDENKQK